MFRISALSFLSATVSFAAVHRVPADHPTIQAGLDFASAGDTVLVADGTYRGDGNRDLDFRGKDLVLRSEFGRDVTEIDCEGTADDPHRGFYLHSGESLAARIEGFTITGGYVLPVDEKPFGGGIWLDHASATVIDCVIRNCEAQLGGAIMAFAGDQEIFLDLIGCDLVENFASTYGGAVYFGLCSAKIEDCRFENNRALNRAGGLYLSTFTNMDMRDSVIRDNAAEAAEGGGIFSYRADVDLERCVIAGNEALQGGGVEFRGKPGEESPLLSMTNCLISDNSATVDGGGIDAFRGAEISARFTTVTGNSAAHGAGIACGESAEVAFSNSIVRGNEAGNEISADDSSRLSSSYSNMGDGWSGEGNIDLDPRFVAGGNGDYLLSEDSPCIDAANPEDPTDRDLEGDERPQGRGYDMGADEFVPACDLNVVLSDYPESLRPNEVLAFRADAENSCDGDLGLNEAIMSVTGPAALERSLYEGAMIIIESGVRVGASVTLRVPPRAPLGVYGVEVTIYRDGEIIDSGAFEVEIRD